MEGWNPNIGCTLNCKNCYRGWVPSPLNHFPRRDPLVDAIGRVDNPCDRPARFPPSLQPVPKFKPPRELPICNLDEYAVEKAEAKYREDCECCEKYENWRNSLTPFFVVSSNDPNHPVNIPNCDDPEKDRYVLVDRPVRTNIINGLFNPDDNKSHDQLVREKCDRFWKPCGPDLRPYPCRGVIDFPRQTWVDKWQPPVESNFSFCAGSKYVDPNYINEQYKNCQNQELAKSGQVFTQNQAEQSSWISNYESCQPPDCFKAKRCYNLLQIK